MPASSP
ncbi:hypothetical protein VCHC57A1_2014, partial [Vibrio cholerae HC-57A1]